STQYPPGRVDRGRAWVDGVVVEEPRGSVTGVAQHPHPGETRGATVLGERIQELLADLRRSHRLRNLETGQEQELAAIGLRDGGAPREPHHGLAVGRDVREAAPVGQERGVGAALEAAEGT